MRYKAECPSSKKEKKDFGLVLFLHVKKAISFPWILLELVLGDPKFPILKQKQHLSLEAGVMVIFVIFMYFYFSIFQMFNYEQVLFG